MLWQDFVFMIGSGFSIVVLAPTLRDATARVPLGTSLPSMAIGIIYGLTFLTLGMTLSAAGAIAAGMMWALVAVCRSPTAYAHRAGVALFLRDAKRWWASRRRAHRSAVEEFAVDGSGRDGRHTDSGGGADVPLAGD